MLIAEHLFYLRPEPPKPPACCPVCGGKHLRSQPYPQLFGVHWEWVCCQCRFMFDYEKLN